MVFTILIQFFACFCLNLKLEEPFILSLWLFDLLVIEINILHKCTYLKVWNCSNVFLI